MFTGLIETLGTIKLLKPPILAFEAELDGIKKGDSISVNGVCLTVTDFFNLDGKSVRIEFDLSLETLKRTSLSASGGPSIVNIERALKLSDRLGGHIVTGHVEATTKIQNIVKTGTAYEFIFRMPEETAKYIIEKGSIAIDGISLTVAAANKDSFTVAVIPYTFENTNLKFKKTGDIVNIEPDIVAKYVENLLKTGNKNKISLAFLKENGF
jgi:riboflavin synthase